MSNRSPRGAAETAYLSRKGRISGDGGNRTHAIVPPWLRTVALAALFIAFFLGPLFLVDAFAKCRTHACWHRVHIARAERWQWRQYKAHPMPYCTWAHESGPPRPGYGPYARARYRVLNTSGSGAGGKFQIMYRTWLAFGGKPYGNARFAPPLEQEKIARRVLAGQGLGAWVAC